MKRVHIQAPRSTLRALDRKGVQYGMYCDNTPEGELVVIQLNQQLNGDHLQTHLGRIEIPVEENQPGPRLMFNRLTNVGGFQIAAKSHSADRTYHWKAGAWTALPQISHGTQGHIFDRAGNLIILPPAPNQDSQGYRYVDRATGRLVGGSETYNDQTPLARALGVSRLWEWTHIDGITIGQGEDGVVAQIDGKRKKIESGDCRFVQFKKTGDKISLAFPRFAQKDAFLLWLTVEELLAMPDESPTPIPVCATVYTRGEVGPCPICGHPKSTHKQKIPEPTMKYRSGSDIEPYLKKRWAELGVPAKMIAVGERIGIRKSEDLQGKSDAEVAAIENEFKAVQVPAFVQIVSELHWTKGMKDVGLSTKNGGNRWKLEDGRTVATDIITLKPIDDQGRPTAGNFVLSDSLISVGRPETHPTWDLLGENNDPNRPWAEPPKIGGVVDPPADTHKYDGGGNDTGQCDICQRPRGDAVHAIPESKVKHGYDGGEQDTGVCDICGRDRDYTLHKQAVPDPGGDPDPITNHKFMGSGRFCSECGKGPADPIHKIAEPIPVPGGGVDEETKDILREILATNVEQAQKLEEIRVGVDALGKKIEAALGEDGGGIIDLFRKKKP